MRFRDLNAQYITLKDRIDQAINDTIETGDFIMGRKVIELEESLADYTGVKYCVSCANGTDALKLVLLAWNVGVGDAVFVPDFTFFSTAEAPASLGAVPIIVDVEPETFNMDPVELEKQIQRVLSEKTLKPKVIIPVDLYGLSANYPAIEETAKKYGLMLLEDAAQGFGGSLNGKRNCGFGNAAITSFFPAKPLGCYGDGGAIFTNDPDMAELAASYRVHGKGKDKYDNIRIGMNARLDTIQAAILLEKFQAFKEYELERINQAAEQYNAALAGIVATPRVPEGYYSSWAQYTVRFENVKQRNMVQKKLRDKGIPTLVYYKRPLHSQRALTYLPQDPNGYPVTDKLCDTVLSLPIHPYIDHQNIIYIADALKFALSSE